MGKGSSHLPISLPHFPAPLLSLQSLQTCFRSRLLPPPPPPLPLLGWGAQPPLDLPSSPCFWTHCLAKAGPPGWNRWTETRAWGEKGRASQCRERGAVLGKQN